MLEKAFYVSMYSTINQNGDHSMEQYCILHTCSVPFQDFIFYAYIHTYMRTCIYMHTRTHTHICIVYIICIYICFLTIYSIIFYGEGLTCHEAKDPLVYFDRHVLSVGLKQLHHVLIM